MAKKQQHEEDSQVEGVLGEIKKATDVPYDAKLLAARKEKFLEQADSIRESNTPGETEEKKNCLDMIFQFLFLAITFGSMIINS